MVGDAVKDAWPGCDVAAARRCWVLGGCIQSKPSGREKDAGSNDGRRYIGIDYPPDLVALAARTRGIRATARREEGGGMGRGHSARPDLLPSCDTGGAESAQRNNEQSAEEEKRMFV